MTLLIAVISPILSSILTVIAKDLWDRHSEKRKLIRQAIVSLRSAQANRHTPNGGAAVASLGDAAQEFRAELSKSGIERFISGMNEARQALIELEPHLQLDSAWTAVKWELTEPEAQQLISSLKKLLGPWWDKRKGRKELAVIATSLAGDQQT
ncbi:hypothetical protein [Streptomyces halstedii]|uniref:hypothetical protein n=1 Tax=Streptomyces halstedii TaxID=1944 RepID=UPI00339E5956